MNQSQKISLYSKKNVEINSYRNVVLVEKAVSDKSGKTNLYLCDYNKGDHRIYNSHKNRPFIKIKKTSLDSYFKNYTKQINFIKMDAQGAEFLILKGMTNLLKKNKKLKIISEFWPMGLEKCGIDPKEYLKLLLDHGFTLYEVNEKKKKIELTNIPKLLKIYTIKNKNFTNLLCIRKK